jgi:hypothetical protein
MPNEREPSSRMGRQWLITLLLWPLFQIGPTLPGRGIYRRLKKFKDMETSLKLDLPSIDETKPTSVESISQTIETTSTSMQITSDIQQPSDKNKPFKWARQLRRKPNRP